MSKSGGSLAGERGQVLGGTWGAGSMGDARVRGGTLFRSWQDIKSPKEENNVVFGLVRAVVWKGKAAVCLLARLSEGP